MSNKSIHEVINSQSLIKIAEHSPETKKVITEFTYEKQLNSLRNYLSTEHATELAKTIGDENASERIKALIRQYIHNKNIVINGDKYELLINRFYDDLAGYAFINRYLFNENIEEINGNAWNDIEIVYSNKWLKAKESFTSPQNAVDIIKKMMRAGGVTLDEKKPIGESYISTGIRVSAMIPPVIDEKKGAVFSLRKQKTRVFSKNELVQNGTCTKQEYEFLQMCLNHGVSVGIAGATSSGKTTDITSLLASINKGKRIYIIEDTREITISRNDNKETINRVIYTKTRPNIQEERNISASDLLRASMRYHPDIIVPAEMRDEVAMVAVEAGRTGHTILAGLHANNAVEAYDRILTMCMMSGTKLSEQLLMKLIISAFPIMVFKAQLPDSSRKYMQIFEALMFDPINNTLTGNMLFQFIVEGRVLNENNTKIKKMLGKHQHIGKISNALANRLVTNGCDITLVKRYASPEWTAGVTKT